MTPVQEVHGLLFSASNLFDLALRLVLAAFLVKQLGYLFVPRLRLLGPERFLIGLLCAFYLFLAGSIVARGEASSLPAWLFALATLAATFRRIVSGRHAKGLALGWRGGVFFTIYFFLLLRADWPRFVPMSSDSHLYTWISQQIWRFGVVPSAQPPIGPDPFHYPAGLGILSYVLGYFSLGLRPLETLPLLASLSVLWLGLYLWRSSPNRREALLMVLGLVGLAWGILYPHREHATFGRTVALPFLLYAALRPFRSQESRAWPWLLAALGPFLLSLNPALAPLILFVLLLSSDHLAVRTSRSVWSILNPVPLLVAGALTLALLVFGDPYFLSFFSGETPRAATMDGGRPLVVRWDLWGGTRSFFASLLQRPLETLNFNLGRGISTFPLLALFLAIPLAIWGLLGTFKRRRWLVARIALATTLFVLFLSAFRFEGDIGAFYLVPAYNRAFVAYFLWALALFGGARALESAWTADAERRAGWRGVLIFALALVWLVGPLHGLAGLAARPYRAFPKLDEATARTLLEVAAIWRRDPAAKILLENYDPAHVGENFLYIAPPIGTAAFLPRANPAFFFFQGHEDFSYRNYRERVCDRLDRTWLEERGIRYLLAAPAPSPRCASMPATKGLRLFKLEDVAKP